jgi:outer membrane lipoprotein-sorting protein
MAMRDLPRMRNRRTWTQAALAAIALACAAAAGAQNMTIDDVYKQMNASAENFKSIEADISVDDYTAVVQDHSKRTGTTALQRANGSMEMVMHLNVGSEEPAVDILYRNGELDAYQPTQKTETVINAGANRGEFDSLLTTGFGATSKELQANWDVSFKGMQSIDDKPCAELDLVSKQQNVKNNFSHVTICVDLAHDISLQVDMIQPSGDKRTATYTNIRYYPKLDDKTFKLDLPSGVQVTRR